MFNGARICAVGPTVGCEDSFIVGGMLVGDTLVKYVGGVGNVGDVGELDGVYVAHVGLVVGLHVSVCKVGPTVGLEVGFIVGGTGVGIVGCRVAS